MPAPLDSVIGQLREIRAITPPTRAELRTAGKGHVWIGQKPDGTSWSINKKSDTDFELHID